MVYSQLAQSVCSGLHDRPSTADSYAKGKIATVHDFPRRTIQSPLAIMASPFFPMLLVIAPVFLGLVSARRLLRWKWDTQVNSLLHIRITLRISAVLIDNHQLHTVTYLDNIAETSLFVPFTSMLMHSRPPDLESHRTTRAFSRSAAINDTPSHSCPVHFLSFMTQNLPWAERPLLSPTHKAPHRDVVPTNTTTCLLPSCCTRCPCNTVQFVVLSYNVGVECSLI
jgi:hypothetical protein